MAKTLCKAYLQGEYDAVYVIYTEFHSVLSQEAKCLQLLTEHPETDAVFAASDYAALGAARAALSMGKKIPDEFSIIGFDDISLAADQLLYPFSTIAQPKEEIGWIAGKMMIDLINGKHPQSQTLEATLVLRSTTRNDAFAGGAEKK